MTRRSMRSKNETVNPPCFDAKGNPPHINVGATTLAGRPIDVMYKITNPGIEIDQATMDKILAQWDVVLDVVPQVAARGKAP